MSAPSWEELCQVRSVVEAEYQSYRSSENSNSIGYFHPPLARYKLLRNIHGATMPQNLELRYDFDSGSICVEPPEWKFSEHLLPRENSRWLLFISGDTNSYYETYRGDLGRVPAGSLEYFFLQECEKFWDKNKKHGAAGG